MGRILDLQREKTAIKLKKYFSYSGPGILKKVKRFGLNPLRYTQYLTVRFFGFHYDSVGKLFWGKKVVLPVHDKDTHYMFMFGALSPSELPLINYFSLNLRSNDIFYDIGSNYGFYTLLAQEIITEGQIHYFEPESSLKKYLSNNIDISNSVFANFFALSNKNGEVDFYTGFDVGQSGQSSTKNAVAVSKGKPYAKTTVQAVTLNTYIQNKRPPTVIKLDVEGGEFEVLEGGLSMLKAYKPIIAMEMWSGESGNMYSLKAYKLLMSLGYKLYEIDEDGILHAKTDFVPSQQSSKVVNYIFK